MKSNTLKVKSALEFMHKYGLTMNEPAFRKAIRNNQIKNTYIINKKEGVNIPVESLINYMVPRLGGNIDAYNFGLGIQQMKYTQTIISSHDQYSLFSLMTAASFDHYYNYCVSNWHNGMKNYLIYIDYGNFIIHIYDDFFQGGTSAINQINTGIIADIWTKLSMDVTDELIEKTKTIIYFQSHDYNSVITAYGLMDRDSNNKEFGFIKIDDEKLYNERFKKEIDNYQGGR